MGIRLAHPTHLRPRLDYSDFSELADTRMTWINWQRKTEYACLFCGMPYAIIRLILALFLAGCVTLSTVLTPIAGSVERGAQLFVQGRGDAPPCSTCHQTVSGQEGFSFGPNLTGIGEHAGTRVEGLTTEEYLRQSILEPDRTIVSGYRNIMYADYDLHFTEQDIQDLIAYLLTL